jgi:hypothetical protein
MTGTTCENCHKASEAGYEEAEKAYHARIAELEADRDKIVADAHLMTQDLHRIAQELGIGARPYSGHGAMDRDILPAIQGLVVRNEARDARARITELEAAAARLREDLRIEREQCDRAVSTLREIAECDETGHTGMTWAKHEVEICIADMRSLEEPS